MQDFERAAKLRDKADKLKKKKGDVEKEWRENHTEVDGTVDAAIVTEVVATMTGIPLKRMEAEEAKKLLNLEAELHKTVIGQDNAIKAVAKAVRRSRAGLQNPNRPSASFIFIGPSGVGKTLLSKALAKSLFGEEESLIQIDMSEYMEKHNVSRLIGAPPGYVGFEEGGQLTEKIRRRPYAVVLLDEIEKAHSDVFNMLLQVMEEGKLTDSFGRHVDFRNVIIIMTSNIGSDIIKNTSSLGFKKASGEQSYESIREQLLEAVEKHFRPEFVNRVNDIAVFRDLTKDDLRKIVEIELESIRSRLTNYNITLTVTREASDFLIDKSHKPNYGARPLHRAIENLIEDPLSENILKGRFKDGDAIEVTLQEGKLLFEEVIVKEELVTSGSDSK